MKLKFIIGSVFGRYERREIDIEPLWIRIYKSILGYKCIVLFLSRFFIDRTQRDFGKYMRIDDFFILEVQSSCDSKALQEVFITIKFFLRFIPSENRCNLIKKSYRIFRIEV